MPLAGLSCEAHLTEPRCASPPFVKILDVPGNPLWSTLPSHTMALLGPDIGVWERALKRAVLPAMPPTPTEQLALRLLYRRSHWVKMPLPLLVRQLWTKYRQGNKH